MDRFEKGLLYLSLALMVLFAAMVLYASMGLGIELPSHHHITPFHSAGTVAKEKNEFEVRYLAKMWSFDPAEVLLPENAAVHFYVSAVDVNHGFQITGTNVNLMAVPGTVNTAYHRFTRKGDYLVVCHEYCGLNHQNMFGKIRVLPETEYTRLMRERAGRITAAAEKLMLENDCLGCHSIDGTEGIGPTFKGMFGRKQKLTDGSEVFIDEAYLMDSIKQPDKHIPVNYEPGSMPESGLSDEDIQHIVEYIKTLK